MKYYQIVVVSTRFSIFLSLKNLNQKVKKRQALLLKSTCLPFFHKFNDPLRQHAFANSFNFSFAVVIHFFGT